MAAQSAIAHFLRRLSFVFLVLIFLVVFPISLYAQSSAGVSIKPALIEDSVDPGVTISKEISVKNESSDAQTFYLFSRNISGVNESSVPIFAKDNNEQTGYELADWITLSKTEFTLEPGASQSISLTLNVPNDASPGSHFGGVFISVDPPEIEKSGAAVGYQVANILSIRVSGDVIEEGNIRQFSTNKFLYGSQNVDFSVRIENSGNVLIKPIGPLEIRNMLGHKVDSITFNEGLLSVFPGRVRDFNLSWEGDNLGFGRYEAILSANYGEQGAINTMSSTVSFWILPWSVIGPALGILAVLLLVIFIFVRIYINRTVAHLANTGTRIVRRRRRKNSSTTLLLVIVMLTVTALFLIVLLALFA